MFKVCDRVCVFLEVATKRWYIGEHYRAHITPFVHPDGMLHGTVLDTTHDGYIISLNMPLFKKKVGYIWVHPDDLVPETDQRFDETYAQSELENILIGGQI